MELSLLLELLAVACCALFAGGAVYISLVEHPARQRLGRAEAIAQWEWSYRRAAPLQASLAVAGSLTAGAVWLISGAPLWLWGGSALLAVVPLTLIVIFPVNRQLHDPALDRQSRRAALLLERWGRLHALRSVLGVLALLLLLIATRSDG